jgi:hypothetical protein
MLQSLEPESEINESGSSSKASSRRGSFLEIQTKKKSNRTSLSNLGLDILTKSNDRRMSRAKSKELTPAEIIRQRLQHYSSYTSEKSSLKCVDDTIR